MQNIAGKTRELIEKALETANDLERSGFIARDPTLVLYVDQPHAETFGKHGGSLANDQLDYVCYKQWGCTLGDLPKLLLERLPVVTVATNRRKVYQFHKQADGSWLRITDGLTLEEAFPE